MKKNILAMFLAGLLAFSLCACGGGETEAESGGEETAKVADLTGGWKLSNASNDDADVVATIKEDNISISFIVEGDSYLYWSGSYVAPTEPGDTYKWTSEADGKAASALLGSSDETKDFSYDNGVLSFDVTIDGDTGTVEMKKVTDAPEEDASGVGSEDKTAGMVDDYEVKINDCFFEKDYEGNDMIVICYDFKNNSDENATPTWDIMTKAFQDGVSLEVAFSGDNSNYDAGIAQKELQPGASIENCQIAYTMTSKSPVEFEIGPIFGDSVLFKTFEVPQ